MSKNASCLLRTPPAPPAPVVPHRHAVEGDENHVLQSFVFVHNNLVLVTKFAHEVTKNLRLHRARIGHREKFCRFDE